MLESALSYARRNREAHLAGLCDWLRIPSISTLPAHAADVRRAAQFAAGRLAALGMRVEVRETPGHPVVYAEWLKPDAPTLLIYGHFDVQPVDPEAEWSRPPFEPVVEGEKLYARGASDDKGQAFAVMAALESYLATGGGLPAGVKLLLEGEEEVTSPSLPAYLRAHAQELAAGAILIADQDMLDPQHPLIMWGARGILYAEIELTGPARDLHSGTFGGSVDNPFNVMVRLLAALQDGASRRVLIPGFYDRVREIGEQERLLVARAPINEVLGLHLTGAPALAGEQGYSLAERVSVRPTFEVHGLAGGFTGEGSKTVIPSRALAKISMRLVPDQDPQEIAALLEARLRSLCPPTVKMAFRVVGSAEPALLDYASPAVQAAVQAYERGFGFTPVFLFDGGSLPILRTMLDVLSPPAQQIPVVMIGFGLPDDRTHSPDERFHLPNFYAGIETVIHYLSLFGELE